jgi:hypothetical protein
VLFNVEIGGGLDILTCVYDHAVIYRLLFDKLRSLVHISAVFVPFLCELNFVGCKLKDGDRVVMIEDVTTSGKSMEETVPKVREAADVTIVGLIVSLNRMEVGQGGKVSALDEIHEKYGFEGKAIVTMAEVTEYLYNREHDGRVVIDDTIKAAIDEYYKQYGCK